MERKIGEIFNIDNEWYQVVKSDGECCKGCAFYKEGCQAKYADVGSCGTSREDFTQVIFKKLEKAGEPVTVKGRTFQRLILDNYSCADCVFNVQNKECNKNSYIDGLCPDDEIWVEIKQIKEDMEKYRMHDAKEDIPEFDKVVDECLFGEDKLNLKPFNLEAAKAGKPVCTRDGRRARIICSDREFIYKEQNYCIVALIKDGSYSESVYSYTEDGLFNPNKIHNNDLMMLPEKHEGWVNVYKLKSSAYKDFPYACLLSPTKNGAISIMDSNGSPSSSVELFKNLLVDDVLKDNPLIATVRIEWNE